MEFIDDHPVTSHRVRFQGRAEITEIDAGHVKDGNVMAWLVRTRCQPPQYHPLARDADDRYRFNIQAVETAMPLTGSARDAALIRLNRGQPQLWDIEDQPDATLEDPDDLHREVAALRDYLAELGELHEGERLVNAVTRVVEQRSGTVMGVGRVEDPAFAMAAQRVSDPDSDVEVVGSIYRNDRKSDLQALLNEQFGVD